MPIILEDTDVNSSASANTKQIAQYGPKDFNSILTGNGINQGLLKSTLTIEGTADITPPNIASIIRSHNWECENHAVHIHDDKKSYTVLNQDISLLGGYNVLNGGFTCETLPLSLFSDTLAVFKRDPAKSDMTLNDPDTLTFKARIFLKSLAVYKSVANYVLPALTLIAVCEEKPELSWNVNINTLTGLSSQTKNPVERLYTDMIPHLEKLVRNHYPPTKFSPITQKPVKCTCYDLIANNAQTLITNEKTRSMYDLIMSELELIKTPGILKSVLEGLSKAGMDALSYANDILSRINIPFTLYRSDVIDVINSQQPNDAKQLKNANMSLSLADTLNAMQNQATAVIPELTGKHYKTNQITLTTEQTQAIETDSKITIVAAGAGTGKSSCIMHRLAFMEENGCDMKQTFVLSFTKAAAQHIKKNFKDCKSSTIAEFTHNFVNVILDDGSHTRIDIISHSDLLQKLEIRMNDLADANILAPSTLDALRDFIIYARDIDKYPNKLLDALDINMSPEANNLLSILKMLHCTSLELDPIIFHSQLSMVQPNIEHIVIDESQDSNKLEFLTMLKMAMAHNISIYIVGDCAQTLYEFRDADPKILNNLTKLFTTFDLSINHRSTQIILDVANLISNTMTTHKTMLKANKIMNITQQAIDDTVEINTYNSVQDPATLLILDKYIERHIGKGESIAVIARSGNDVNKLYEYLKTKYGTQYTVENITSQRRNDITILSTIGSELETLFPKGRNIADWADFENAVRAENIRINSITKKHNKYNQNGPQVNKITTEWLAEQQADGTNIINDLNGTPTEHDAMIRKLQLSLLDMQTKKNNILQRVMDQKNAKAKSKAADIIVCTVHGVKGLEYDNVACFINTDAGRNYSNSDENKRIAYVALTRAKLTECVFCTREKLVKDFEAYRASKPSVLPASNMATTTTATATPDTAALIDTSVAAPAPAETTTETTQTEAISETPIVEETTAETTQTETISETPIVEDTTSETPIVEETTAKTTQTETKSLSELKEQAINEILNGLNHNSDTTDSDTTDSDNA